jgi:hypothetical protein
MAKHAGDMAVELAQSRAGEGASEDETKEIKKQGRQN